MSAPQWMLLGFGVALLAWLGVVLALVALGRREDARALAGFIPDLIPVFGQLDDAIVAALALRFALRSGGPELLREHWPGPARSLAVVTRIAWGGPG